MDIIGIIAEYNPFHNGHLYHIKKIKELYPNKILILVLNGYFLERGETSIISKENKTKLALNYGIDIVIELPFVYGTQSADKFSEASLKLLNTLGVNKIIFGSECNDIEKLTEIAKKQIKDDLNIKLYLKEGLNYPTSLNKALKSNINTPNDILGITYIKTILKNNYNIKAISIQRTNDYHDIESNDMIISASNIREKIKNNINIESYLPNTKYINNINEELLFNLLKYKISTEDNLGQYLTVDEGIENKIKKEINNSNTLEELIINIKSKRYTYNRLKRMLIHILMGLKKEDANLKIEYVKLLGFNKSGKNYINTIKKTSPIPILTKIDKKDKIREYELKTATIYQLLTNENVNLFEQKNKPIIK